MKKALTIIVILFCNLNIAQNRFLEKKYNTEHDDNCLEITINPGKPIFVVVYINNSTPNDSLVAVREYNELQKNFKDSNVYFLTKKGKIKLNNGDKTILLFDEVNESYERIIYWDGKKESQTIAYESISLSSEYFSELMNDDKTSSYVIDYNDQINAFNQQLIWEPDVNSRTLSDKYIKKTLFEQLYIDGVFSEFLNFDLKGVKSLTINSNLQNIKNPWQEIFFNDEGLPTQVIVTSDDSDGKKGTISYEYNDNLISKITINYKNTDGGEDYEHVTNVHYSNGNLILVDEGLRITFYSLDSEFLVYKSYYTDERIFDFLIDTLELLNDNNLKFTEFSNLNNYTLLFNNKEGFLPVTYTLRPEADEHSKSVSILTKVDNLNFSVISEKVAYKKFKYLNKNLISEVLLIDPDDISKEKELKQYKFDFKYEYYK